MKKKKSSLKESHNNFQPAAPAVVAGDLRPIGKRDFNQVPPKFAMLLKDTDENSDTVYRLLVTYPNGESLVIPPAGDPGASDGDELLAQVLDCLAGDDRTVAVVSAALDRIRGSRTASFDPESLHLKESVDKHMVQALIDFMEQSNLYRRMIVPSIKNFERKLKSGKFDAQRAVKQGENVAKELVKEYEKDNRTKLNLTRQTKQALAIQIAVFLEKEARKNTKIKEDCGEKGSPKGEVKESSITDRYQKSVNALNALKRPVGQPSNSPASMTKLEAIGVIRDMGLPEEKIIHALVQAGHTMEDIDDLLVLARQGIK